MSNINFFSSSSSSYASYSSSSFSSSSTANGTQSQSFSEQRTYNPRDGHTVTRSAQKDGGPVYRETTTVPGNRTLGGATNSQGRITDVRDGGARSSQGRITDVTDDGDEAEQKAQERKYEERIEDEYAKREGGA